MKKSVMVPRNCPGCGAPIKIPSKKACRDGSIETTYRCGTICSVYPNGPLLTSTHYQCLHAQLEIANDLIEKLVREKKVLMKKLERSTHGQHSTSTA